MNILYFQQAQFLLHCFDFTAIAHKKQKKSQPFFDEGWNDFLKYRPAVVSTPAQQAFLLQLSCL